MRPRLGVDPAGGLHLDGVIPHRSRGVESLPDVPVFEDGRRRSRLQRREPDAGEAVGLELERDGAVLPMTSASPPPPAPRARPPRAPRRSITLPGPPGLRLNLTMMLGHTLSRTNDTRPQCRSPLTRCGRRSQHSIRLSEQYRSCSPWTQLRPASPERVVWGHATPSVFHQCDVGRLLRPSCRHSGRRPTSSRGREPRASRCPPLRPGDLRDDGGSVAGAGADWNEA